MERVHAEPAYVLHGRAYRETSEILELLTRNHGRIGLVARGMRGGAGGRRGSHRRAILQPFQPIEVSWSGRGHGLMTLNAVEPAGAAARLGGTSLMSAFYVNELVLRFLHKSDPHPQLFESYARLLLQLGSGPAPDIALRRFELDLLVETGYGLNLDHDAASGEPLNPATWYEYVVERGPIAAEAGQTPVQVFSGAALLAIGRADFSDENCRASARRLLREVLNHHLGGRPLRSRQVFAAMRR